MLVLVLAYAVVAVVVPWVFGRHRRVMACAAAVLPAATAGWAAAQVGRGALTARLDWAPELGLVFDFRLDALSIVMLLLIGGVGAVVLCYAGWYFDRSERLMIGTLVAFAGAMTGLVLSDNLLVLYVFWELTTVSSFVLIGATRPERAEDRRAAAQALLTTTAFGLLMLAGFVLLGQAAGTYRISAIAADPPRGGTATAATASMIGLPPFLGFVAKEAAMEAFAHGGWDVAVLIGVVAGSALTVAYGVRFLVGAFGGQADVTPGGHWGLVGPVVVLAGAGFALGVAPGAMQKLAGPYAGTLPGDGAYKLALWHGPGSALWLSVVALVSGAVVFVLFGRTFPVRRPRWRFLDAQRGYDGTVEGILAGAHEVTRRVQIGSLPVYLGVIGVMALVVPGSALAAALVWGTGPAVPVDRLRAWDDPAQVVLAVVVIGCALAALRARRRLTAALLLAGTGYGVAGLFVVQGGPDLALTLFVVETLSLIMLVLVLRRLPVRYPPRRRKGSARAVVGAISVCLGGFVALFLVVAALSRDTRPAGPGYARLASEEGAENVVNAILVEMRALDTLGEITVLGVAAMGVVGLVTSGRRLPSPAGGERGPGEAGSRWLAAPGRPPLGGSSVVLEAAARFLGPTILVFSLYLLVAGHGHPGGGFVGGLVAGMAFVLRYLPGGRRELASALPVRPSVLIGGGLGLAVATGAAGWTAGGFPHGEFLQGEIWHASPPVLGEVEVPTSLFFDIGVYLVVLGLVLTILTTLGAGLEDERDEEEAA
ncbi:hydrogen gas-evolving membrane-bound hydrogenase subunit E [Spirillospora sp. CA-108201]